MMRPWIGRPAITSSIISVVSGELTSACAMMSLSASTSTFLKMSQTAPMLFRFVAAAVPIGSPHIHGCPVRCR